MFLNLSFFLSFFSSFSYHRYICCIFIIFYLMYILRPIYVCTLFWFARGEYGCLGEGRGGEGGRGERGGGGGRKGSTRAKEKNLF